MLKSESHFTAHVLRMLREIGVDFHGGLPRHDLIRPGLGVPLPLVEFVVLTAGNDRIGYIYGVGRHLAVHALADDDYVRGGTSPLEGGIIQTEGSDNISVALVHQPLTESLATAVERATGGNEDAQTARGELADILGDAEVVNPAASELAGDILLLRVVNLDIVAERHIGYGQINGAVGDVRVLESLHHDIGIGIQEGEDTASRLVEFDRGDFAPLAHGLRHGGKDIADTGRAFQDITALESETLGDIPHGINYLDGRVVRRVDGIGRHLHFLVGKQGFQFSVFRRVFVVEVTAEATPAGELAKDGHLLLGRSLAAVLQFLHQPDRGDVGLVSCGGGLGIDDLALRNAVVAGVPLYGIIISRSQSP